MRYCTLPVFFVALVAAAVPAWAADVDGFHPPCGAPGDLIYVQGTGFAARPIVAFGGQQAEVLRRGADVLLCRVPRELAEEPVELRVDGAAAPLAFQPLAVGRPVVHGLSAVHGTRGQVVFAYGRRLHGSRLAFVDGHGRTAATVEGVGGRRATVFLVPKTLDEGAYDLVLTNGDGLSTGACSRRFDVVPDADPELGAVHPADAVPSRSAAPGQRIRCLGTGLGPRGPCRVHWSTPDGVIAESRGRSNGYDIVLTSVPEALAGGTSYDIAVELRSGALTPILSWTPGTSSLPTEAAITPSSGPAGCTLSVRGSGLDGSIGDVRAELSSKHGSAAAQVVFRHPGGLGHGAAWVLRVPDGLADGDYELTLRIGDRIAPTMTFHVAEQPLAVTELWPTRPPRADGDLPTLIEGSGFGTETAADDLRVVWTDGTHVQEGTIVFRCDRAIRVLPLGAYREGSAVESWSVYVLRGHGAGTRVVKAGAVHGGDSGVPPRD